jgi:hypothetical protein
VIETGPGWELRLSDGDIARFWSLVTKGDVCWNWSRKVDAEGYGRFRVGGKQHRTHRIAWAIKTGSLPEQGIYVLHRCDNRMCVRPDHLFAGTHLDNIADMLSRGRGSKPPRHVGDGHPQAKITGATVAALRERVRSGESQRALAIEFHLSESTVSSIVLGRTWKEVA